MAETVQGLMDAVTQEANFDVTGPQALAWINRRWRTMVSRAKAYRKTIAVGNTVAGTADYALPAGVLEVLEFDVGGLPYGKARRVDIAEDQQGWITLRGPGGVVAVNASSAGVGEFSLIPTPTDVQPISLFAVLSPPDLTADATGDGYLTSILDPDFVEPLILGAMATGYRREGNINLAAANEQSFDGACEEFRRRVARRYRGSGPAQVRIIGVNA